MDPPYWQTAGYGVGFPFENYERMANFMRCCKGKVMGNINDHPDIRWVFNGFYFQALEIRYNTNQRQGEAEVCGGDHELGAGRVGRIVLKGFQPVWATLCSCGRR
jgi:DNA adenine methylase